MSVIREDVVRVLYPRVFIRGDEQLTNTTRVGITGNGDGSYEYRLTALRKYTQYSIVVKAFNSKGDGPGSDPIITQTLESGTYSNKTPRGYYDASLYIHSVNYLNPLLSFVNLLSV